MTIEEQIHSLYSNLLGKALEVKEIFEYQYGPEFVDCGLLSEELFTSRLYEDISDIEDESTTLIEKIAARNYVTDTYIVAGFIIYFPTVTVTNEYDQSINIQDLYVTFSVKGNGTLAESFRMMRSTFPLDQLLSGYSHSHLPTVGIGTVFDWRRPCVGEGPIRITMWTIMDHFDANIWGLFAYELSKYVTIESIAGTPYIRLSSVGGKDYKITYTRQNCPYLHDKVTTLFVKDFIRTYDYSLTFVNGSYKILPTLDNIISISNAFTKWINNQIVKGKVIKSSLQLLQEGYIQEVLISNGSIYQKASVDSRRHDFLSLEGHTMFTFKGNPVHFHILDLESAKVSTFLLSPGAFNSIRSIIIKLINYHESIKQSTVNAGSQPYII